MVNSDGIQINGIGLIFHDNLDLFSIIEIDKITRKVYLSISMFSIVMITLYYHVFDVYNIYIHISTIYQKT